MDSVDRASHRWKERLAFEPDSTASLSSSGAIATPRQPVFGKEKSAIAADILPRRSMANLATCVLPRARLARPALDVLIRHQSGENSIRTEREQNLVQRQSRPLLLSGQLRTPQPRARTPVLKIRGAHRRAPDCDSTKKSATARLTI